MSLSRQSFLRKYNLAHWDFLLLVCLVLSVCWALTPAKSLAQLPASRLSAIFPPGGAAGQTFDVTISGSHMDGVESLLFSHTGIIAKQKMAEPGPFDKGPVPVELTFQVTVAANVPMGGYDVRAIGKYGVSNPRRFLISKQAEFLEAEPNQDIETATPLELPCAVNGLLNAAADVDYYTFTAKSAGRMILDCYARRMDSQTDAVVVVYDAVGRELGNSRDGQSYDPLVDFNVTAGQKYSIRVYDSAYRGGPGFSYRFTLGALPHIDYIFPPAAIAGNRPFTIFGRNLPGGQNAGLAIDGRPLQKMTANIAIPNGVTPVGGNLVAPGGGGLDGVGYIVNSPAGASNRVFVGRASTTPVLEVEPNNLPTQSQLVTVPSEVMGQFYPRRDADWFQFDATEGEQIILEVVSQRTGIKTNPTMLIEQIIPADGDKPGSTKQIAFESTSGQLDSGPEFDTRNQDPLFQFAVPATGRYRVLLRDQLNALKADPRQVYRLAIRRPLPDFRLVAVPEDSYDSVLLRKGGKVAIRIVAFRRDGFEGEIKVAVQGLPAGVTASESTIGPKRNSTPLVLSAAANAAPSFAAIRIQGSSTNGTANLVRVARLASAINPLPMRLNNNNARPTTDGRLVETLVVTVSPEVEPVAIEVGENKVWDTSRGGIVKVPFTRVGAFKGKLTLFPRGLPANVTAPTLTINPNVNAGTYEIKLSAKTPTGSYSFNLDGIAEQVDYSRNPEAAKAAAERKVEVDKIAAEQAAAAKAAADAKVIADKMAIDAAASTKAATDKVTASEQLVAQTQVAVTTTTEQVAAAQKSLAANAEDTALKNALAIAQKLLVENNAKAKAAADAMIVAKKVLGEEMAKEKLAVESKEKSDTLALETAEISKLATALKVKTDKLATDTATAAKPKKVNVAVFTSPVLLSIINAPISVTPPAGVTPLKQGEKVELPINIARLQAYNGNVTVAAILPSGVAGLSVPNATIAAGQTQTKLTVTAAANATPGMHDVTVRATLNLNGQNLIVNETFKLNVIIVVPPPTK